MKSNFREFAILCLVATDKTVASGIRRCPHANLAISTHSQGNTLVLVISIIADFLISLLDQLFMHFRLFVCQRRHNFHGRVVPLECYQQPKKKAQRRNVTLELSELLILLMKGKVS